MKKLLVLLGILFLLPAINALTLSSDKAETCATDTSVFLFTVSNTANFENSYTVSLTDSAGRWAIAAPAGFNLKQGQSQTVYVYVTPSISANPGIYQLKVTLSSLAGTDSATAAITVKDCHSATLTAAAANAEVCSATEAKYPLTLKNTGKYTENFVLSISGVPAKWSTLSEELVRLETGQTKDMIVYSTPPADQTGNFALTITAASQNSRALASADLKLTSKGCYDFSANADTNYVSFCENSEAKIPLAIENKGSVDNSYTIDVEGPVWSTVDNTKIDIPAQQGKFTNITLFPGFGVAGDFKIKVTVTPKTGESQEQIIQANVRSCHDTSLKLAAVEDTICPHTSKMYAVSLVNNGEFTEKYALTVTGADFASLDKDFVELGAGNSTEFNLVVAPKDNPAETKTIVVRAEAQEPSHASATTELKLKIAPMSSCYGVQATSALTGVNVAAGEPAVVPIIVENKGLENSTYNLDVSGTGAQFVQLNPASLQLDGKSSATVYAYIAVPEQTAESSYKVTVSARLADGTVSSATTFDINLGKAAAQPEQKPAAKTPRERLIAVKDEIVAFFNSIGEKLKSVKMPSLAMPNLNLKLPALNLSFMPKEKGNVTTPEENETAGANETNETNETGFNETVFPEENITNETGENITITENATEGENQTQQIPENVSKFLSPEAAAKLSENNMNETANETGGNESAAAVTGLKAKLPSLPTLSLPALPSIKFVKDFLMESTYYIPNWLFIILVIVIVAALSYLVRRKDLVQKFNEFLEEEPAETKEKKEETKPAAQDLLDEAGKEEKKEKPKRKAKKK
jgi:uncharacterized membrane protein/Na+-transporting methylmalonyl-CoA/oxaloacetate decarboxylase gamma subunit